jgi:hypothetical protein
VKRVAFTVLCSTILCTENASPATDSIRVLLLDGQTARAYHNWQLTKRVMKKELEDTGRFQVMVDLRSPEATSATSRRISANIRQSCSTMTSPTGRLVACRGVNVTSFIAI